MNNILITGANGQLGSELKELSKSRYKEKYKFIFTDQDTLDITNKNKIYEICISENIDSIINCAAYTAVDKAESDKDLAFMINRDAAQNLAEVSCDKGIKLVHISTDYVFDGKQYRPYMEDDSVNPLSVYGKSKLEGEQKLLDINPLNSVIIRTSWLYSSFGNNFFKTMLKLVSERDSLNVVFDQVGTPTYAGNLASVILQIIPHINNDKVDIYHYSNEGVASWYDFAIAIMNIAGKNCDIKPINTSQYPTPAVRPHYSVLDKSKIKKNFKVEIPYWQDSLKLCFERVVS